MRKKKKFFLIVNNMSIFIKPKKFQFEGYNLDISYISKPESVRYPGRIIIASEKNNNSILLKFLDTVHPNSYKIYNLLNEIEENNPCSITLLENLCLSISEYLKESFTTVVIQSKHGSGSSLLLVCSYLLYSGTFFNVPEVIKFYNSEQLSESTPSQLRYLDYFNEHLKNKELSTPLYVIKKVIFHGIPSFDLMGGSNPYLTVMYKKDKQDIPLSTKKTLFTFPFYSSSLDLVEIDYSQYNIMLYGDSRIDFYDHDDLTSDDHMFSLWINTKFLKSEKLLFTLQDLDINTSNLNKFQKNFAIEIVLEKKADDGEKVISKLII